MIRINMTRINALRNIASTRDSVAWGKDINQFATSIRGNINALVFAAALIVCSVTVGCTSEKPQPISSNNQIPVTQAQTPILPAPVMQAESKPAPKKVVHRKPATVNYTDKTYGVTFEYPRRYAIETGDAAADLLTSSPVPMNFVQPGGVALAAVELPETSFANTDFSSAFFNVSVNKTLTADQCSEFAVPTPKVVAVSEVKSETKPEAKSEAKPTATPEPAPVTKTEAVTPAAPSAEATTAPTTSTTVEVAKAASPDAQPAAAVPATTQAAASPDQSSTATTTSSAPATSTSASSVEPASGSKLLLGNMELRATEAVSGEGTRQSDSKYFHIYQNGSCYEFALNVTTVASSDGLIKHVDRDKVFTRLEKILDTVKIDTVKINPLSAPEVTAEAPVTQPAANPAQ